MATASPVKRGTLADGTPWQQTAERRCVKCGTWLGPLSGRHGSFDDLVVGMLCDGKGGGRVRYLYEVARRFIRPAADGSPRFDPHSWQRPTPAQLKEIRDRR